MRYRLYWIAALFAFAVACQDRGDDATDRKSWSLTLSGDLDRTYPLVTPLVRTYGPAPSGIDRPSDRFVLDAEQREDGEHKELFVLFIKEIEREPAAIAGEWDVGSQWFERPNVFAVISGPSADQIDSLSGSVHFHRQAGSRWTTITGEIDFAPAEERAPRWSTELRGEGRLIVHCGVYDSEAKAYILDSRNESEYCQRAQRRWSE